MMQGRFSIDDPDYMKATLEITMTLGEWKSLKEGLNDKMIPLNFKNLIRGIINKAEIHFDEQVEV